MGFILKSAGTKKRGLIHGEAKRTTFAIYTDFGTRSIELPWESLGDVGTIVARLKAYHKNGHRPAPTPDCTYCGSARTLGSNGKPVCPKCDKRTCDTMIT